MPKRSTIEDLAKAAGVSVATVDRVLNRRLPVRMSTAERVLAAAEAIGFHATSLLKQRVGQAIPRIGFVLQKQNAPFYHQFAADIEAAADAGGNLKARVLIEYADELSPGTIIAAIRRLVPKVDALAIVSIDHPHVSEELARLREAGIPTVALLSDLTAETRAGYVGRDNRKEGRTAAWLITKLMPHPGKIGIIVGSHRYLCQETAEISFRTYCREHAPAFTLLEPLVNLEDPRIAYEATLDLIARNSDLVGLYICGGGPEGVIRAVREELGPEKIALVCNELTPVVRAGLIDGIVTGVIATPTFELATRAIQLLVERLASPGTQPPSLIQISFQLLVRENV